MVSPSSFRGIVGFYDLWPFKTLSNLHPEFLTTNGEERGFNPAVTDVSNCFPSRAPRSPALAGLRGTRDEPEAGSRFAAGLKPRPSGRPTQNGRTW